MPIAVRASDARSGSARGAAVATAVRKLLQHSGMQLLTAIALTCLFTTTPHARTARHAEAFAERCAPPEISLHGPVHDVAATPSLVAALRAGDVVLLDRCGRTLVSRARPDTDHADARSDRVLVSGDRVWALLSGSVYRQDELQLTRIPGPDAELLAASPEGGLAVATSGRALFAATENQTAFARRCGLPSRPHALAVSGGGDVFVADERGIWLVTAGGAEQLLAGEISDIAWCGGALTALGSGSIWTFASDKQEWRRTPAPTGVRLRCGSGRFVWWAVIGGEQLWLTHDAGKSWLALDELSSVNAAAMTDEHSVWVAAPEGLVHVTMTHAPADERLDRSLLQERVSRRFHPTIPPPWLALLPRLDVCLSVRTSDTRNDVQGWLWLSWPIPSMPRPRTVASRPSRHDAPETDDHHDNTALPERREGPL